MNLDLRPRKSAILFYFILLSAFSNASNTFFFIEKAKVAGDSLATLKNLASKTFLPAYDSVLTEDKWIRGSLVNSSNKEQKFYLLVYDYLQNKILRQASNGVEWTELRYGIYRPEGSTLYLICCPPNSKVQFYEYTKAYSRIPVSVSETYLRILQEQDELKLLGKTIWQAIFYGIVFFQFCFTLLQGVYIRKPEYAYYLSYMVVITTYFFSKYEFLFSRHFIFSQHITWWIYLDKPLPFLSYFLYYRLARTFVDVPRIMPKLNKQIIVFEWILLTYALTDFLFIVFTGNTAIENFGFMFFSVFVFMSTIYIIVKFLGSRITLTYFILTGAVFMTVGSFGSFVFFTLIESGVLKTQFDTLVFNQIGTILELFAFTTGLAYKSRLDEKEKLKAQQQLVLERERIARDLHDDIGSTLGSISVYTEVAKKRLEKNQNADEVFDKLGETTREMIEKMSDIVWSVNQNNDSFEQLISRMKSFADMLLKPKNISYSFSITGEPEKLPWNAQQRKNVFLIFKESIYNAVKYSLCTHIEITIHWTKGVFTMQISDNGKGFDISHIDAHNGNGINNMKARARDLSGKVNIISAKDTGTIITLECEQA